MKGSEVNRDRPRNLIKWNVSLLKYKWKALLLLFKTLPSPLKGQQVRDVVQITFVGSGKKQDMESRGQDRFALFTWLVGRLYGSFSLCFFLLPVCQDTITCSTFLLYLT